jgi:hypothetical protein
MIRRDEHAQYTIELQGVLDSSWAEAFSGMTIDVFRNDGIDATRLVGVVADQTALAGILDLAFTLGLPLLSVICHGRPQPGAVDPAPPTH